MGTYNVEKAKVLQQLINRFENHPLKKGSKDDRLFLKDSLNRLFSLIDKEYREQLGTMYETIDFKLIEEDNNFLGAYYSNIGVDKNGHIGKRDENSSIRFNFFNYFSDNYLGSSSLGDRIGSCINIVDTLEHEFTHYFQNIQRVQDKISPGSIESAKQSIETKLKYKDVYDNNYWSMADEIGARINAYVKTTNIIKSIPDADKVRLYMYYYNKFRDPIEFDKYLRNTATFREANAGNQDKDYFFDQRADEYIKNNPDILSIYKTLQNEYNMDGTKKSISQLLSDAKKKMAVALNKKDLSTEKKQALRIMVRNTYFDLLEGRLDEITVSEAKQIESQLGGDGTNNLYDNMYKYYEGKYYKKKADYEQIEKMYQDSRGLRAKNNNIKKSALEEDKRICKEKYERVLTNVLRLKNRIYSMDKTIINGVDLSNIRKIKLSEDHFNVRKEFAKQMIETYNILEDDNDFNKRQMAEYRYFAMIMNAVNTQRCARGFLMDFEKDEGKPYNEQQIRLMMRMIKAADTLTIKGGPNILQEFMNTPFINHTLAEIKHDPTYEKMMQQACKIPHSAAKETINDRAKRIAKEKMDTLSEENARKQFGQYKRHSSTSRFTHENAEDEWKDAIYRISAAQQGFKVGPTDKLGYMTIINSESSLINSEDIRNFGREKVVKKVLVNGIEYEAIAEKKRAFSERT